MALVLTREADQVPDREGHRRPAGFTCRSPQACDLHSWQRCTGSGHECTSSHGNWETNEVPRRIKDCTGGPEEPEAVVTLAY